MRDAPHLYNWKGFPKKDQLIAVGEIIVRYLSGPRMQNLGISSSSQLHWHLTRLGGGIQPYLNDVANGVLEHHSVSAKIDEALKIVRNIIGYSFPQDLMVVHHIQAEVARMLEVSPGDYSVYADAAKNLFLPELISALDEYGIPLQIATKLSVYLEPLFELDAIISRLRTLDVENLDSLTPYERRFVKQVQETL